MYSTAKCVIPCLNGGRCRGVNKCRCVGAFKGDHCEVTPPAKSTQRNLCQRPCRNGICTGINRCLCHEGWHGKFCHRRNFYFYSYSAYPECWYVIL